MLDGTYRIDVDSPLGRKSGTIKLATRGDTVDVAIDAPIIGRQRIAGQRQGEGFTASGSLKIMFVGKVDYTAEGHVDGDMLHAVINTSKGSFNVQGRRQ